MSKNPRTPLANIGVGKDSGRAEKTAAKLRKILRKS
jgi:hypothetical protein